MMGQNRQNQLNNILGTLDPMDGHPGRQTEYPVTPQVRDTVRKLTAAENEARRVKEAYLMGVRDQLGIPAGHALEVDPEAGVIRIVEGGSP